MNGYKIKNDLIHDNVVISNEIVAYFKRHRLTANDLEYIKLLSSIYYDNIRDILPGKLPKHLSMSGFVGDAVIQVLNHKTKEECLKDLIFCSNVIYNELLTTLKSEQVYNIPNITKYTQSYFVQFNALIRMFEYKIRKY